MPGKRNTPKGRSTSKARARELAKTTRPGKPAKGATEDLSESFSKLAERIEWDDGPISFAGMAVPKPAGMTLLALKHLHTTEPPARRLERIREVLAGLSQALQTPDALPPRQMLEVQLPVALGLCYSMKTGELRWPLANVHVAAMLALDEVLEVLAIRAAVDTDALRKGDHAAWRRLWVAADEHGRKAEAKLPEARVEAAKRSDPATGKDRLQEASTQRWLADIASKVDELLERPGAMDRFQSMIEEYEQQGIRRLQKLRKWNKRRRRYFEKVISHNKSPRTKETKRRKKLESKGWRYEEYDTRKVFALPAKKGYPRTYGVGPIIVRKGWVRPGLVAEGRPPEADKLFSLESEAPVEKKYALLGVIHDAVLRGTRKAYRPPERDWSGTDGEKRAQDLEYLRFVAYEQHVCRFTETLKAGARDDPAHRVCHPAYQGNIESFFKDVEKDVREKGKRKGSEAAAGNTAARAKRRGSDDRLLLIHALLAHHKLGHKDSNFEPASQKQIAKTLGWAQSKVSRVMTNCVTGGMKAYRRNCRTRVLEGFLKRLDDGSTEVEAPSEEE